MEPINHSDAPHLPSRRESDAALDPWSVRWTQWCQRLRALGLAGMIDTLLDVAEPLGPLGAQLLWVAQPTLSLFMPRGEITTLAQWLDEPGGVARLREQLLNVKDETA